MDAIDQHLNNLFQANNTWWHEHGAHRKRVLAVMETSWAAVGAIATISHLPPIAVHRLMMWQTARLYQVHSLFLILGQQLDGGMALLRMAAELTRDVAFIADEPTRLDLWLRRADKSVQKEYRRLARFDEADPIMAYVKKAYDLASTWGIHSHITAASHLEMTATVAGIARVEVEGAAIVASFRVWGCAFAPIQLGCAATFLPTYHAQLEAPLRALRVAGDALCHSIQSAA